MGMVSIKAKGNFKRTTKWLSKIDEFSPRAILEKYGETGVEALRDNTPKDSGLTASSWYYMIKKTKTGYDLIWRNTNIVDGVNVALILQYGHATKSGTYVSGFDYINPTLKKVFTDIKISIEKEMRPNGSY